MSPEVNSALAITATPSNTTNGKVSFDPSTIIITPT